MALKFDGLVEYSKEPDRLRGDLQRQNQKISEAFRRAEQQFDSIAAERFAGGAVVRVKAAYGDAVLCDTTVGDVFVELPLIRTGESGRFVDIVHTRGINSVWLLPGSAEQFIQGLSQVSYSAIGMSRVRVYGGHWWIQL